MTTAMEDSIWRSIGVVESGLADQDERIEVLEEQSSSGGFWKGFSVCVLLFLALSVLRSQSQPASQVFDAKRVIIQVDQDVCLKPGEARL